MKERDSLRLSGKNLSPVEKAVQHEKFKRLRNRVNSMIKADVIKYNEERITKADDINEVWKVVSDIATPRVEAKMTLKENGKIIENESEVAEILNDFFITKIKDLKSSIDPQMKEDPIQRLEKKLANNSNTFRFKLVSEDTVQKTINSLKQKRSAGADDLTQQQLKHGAENLTGPLTKIINKSLSEGIFPSIWKQAIVTPILKKGDAQDKTNYRPVSCLMVLSKVLEKIVCSQITEYMETNKLIPDNQHGFRKGRSTMTALSDIQQEWTKNTDDKFITGILLWDLSAAFDTLSADIFCKKLKVYGFDQNSINWFMSFLTGRSQKVFFFSKVGGI